jgi:hypothetical protein
VVREAYPLQPVAAARRRKGSPISAEDFLDSRFRESSCCLVLGVCLPGNIGGFLKIKESRIDMNAHKKILIVSKILVCLLFVTALLFAAGVSARGASLDFHGAEFP